MMQWASGPSVYPTLFNPDTSGLSAIERATVLKLYGGIAFAGLVTVPDVTGLSQADAEAALVAMGLVLGAVTEANSDSVALGLTISQDPSAGSDVLSGSAVAIVVSLGAAAVPGGSSRKARRRDERRRKSGEQPQHYIDPERVKIYARAGTDLVPQAKPAPSEAPTDTSIAEPVTRQVELALDRMQRSESEAVEAIAAERKVLAFLEAEEREQAMRLRKLEQEALLAYLMVA